MKTCTRCGQEKPPSYFAVKGKYKNRETKRQSWCKECNRSYQRQHYLDNRETYIKNATSYTKKMREIAFEFTRQLKENTPCKDCNKSFHFSAMDFDHLEDKSFSIGDACSNGYSIERIKEEIAKCEIVCSNCHRIRTYNRRLSSSTG